MISYEEYTAIDSDDEITEWERPAIVALSENKKQIYTEKHHAFQ